MRYYEDIEIGEVEEHGEYEVTKEEIKEFARKYDPQPFHVDEDAAKDSIFGGLVASGWHTAAIMMRLGVMNRGEESALLGSSGLDELSTFRGGAPGLKVRGLATGRKHEASRPGRKPTC